jgi:plastocyanin
MQVTTTVQEKENSWLATVGLGLGILVCLLLFGLVIARMGLLNGLVRGRETAASASLNAGVPGTIRLTAKDMRFGQDEIHLKVGQTVTFTLDNADLYAHSFDADDFDVHNAMPANSQVTASFTATRPGTFDFYCGVPGHQQAGMVGKIIVEP